MVQCIYCIFAWARFNGHTHPTVGTRMLSLQLLVQMLLLLIGDAKSSIYRPHSNTYLHSSLGKINEHQNMFIRLLRWCCFRAMQVYCSVNTYAAVVFGATQVYCSVNTYAAVVFRAMQVYCSVNTYAAVVFRATQVYCSVNTYAAVVFRAIQVYCSVNSYAAVVFRSMQVYCSVNT